jgi:hypothetical protein
VNPNFFARCTSTLPASVSSPSFVPVPQALFLDMENVAETLGHRRGKTAPPALVIADHVLLDSKLIGQLRLSEPSLETRTGEEIPHSILLHFLPELRLLDRNGFLGILSG